ncbi:hypothetical protein EYC84_009668 [Monilinia fructicola]|uniref:Copper acquisition factor BIM1-like domain-containing protein n=1 Tax=Monilinia fructicola TaxID=38448 RepID=A0A5M9JD64_MONFR|nr:hypothetical protein EYC84_009668 [Monilinia fructicola]
MTSLDIFLLLAFLSSLVSAHFSLQYPPARGDSFLPPASQWVYPCANINTTENRTAYPTDSFAIGVELHHNWTYMFVNLGLGTNGSSNLNISLTPSPLNVTGKGSLCLKELDIPADLRVENGLNATIQVVTVGESGSALYNCADITFSTNTTALNISAPDSENCPNTDAIRVEELTTATATSSTTNTTSSASASSSSSGERRARASLSAGVILLGALGISSLLIV